MITATRSSRSNDTRERDKEREPVSAKSSRRNPKNRQRDTPKGFYTDLGSDEEEDENRASKKKRRLEEEEDEDSDEDESEEEEEDEDSEDEEDDNDDDNNDEDDNDNRDNGPPQWSCSVRYRLQQLNLLNSFSFSHLMFIRGVGISDYSIHYIHCVFNCI